MLSSKRIFALLADTDMLEHIPEGTEAIIFNGNRVPNLDWNIFGYWDDHAALEVVDLTNNGIRDIPGKTFHKVSKVKRLVLDHNDIQISGPNFHPRVFSNFVSLEHLHLTNAFTETVNSKWYLADLKSIFHESSLKKLTRLHLEQNEIWNVEDSDVDIFCELPQLTDLYLGDNQLTSIDFALECLDKLTYLDVEYNKIKRLDNATMAKIEKIFAKGDSKHVLNLKGNPFSCDCDLRPMYEWLTSTSVQFFQKEELRCFDGFPESNAGKRIINLSQLRCPPESPQEKIVTRTREENRALSAVTVVSLLVATAAVSALVYSQRQRVKQTMQPLIVGFRRSMQYRTIGDREEFAAYGPPSTTPNSGPSVVSCSPSTVIPSATSVANGNAAPEAV